MRALAQELGVSTATVSRALQNNRAIHSSTRARVIAAAVESGYDRPTRAAGGRDGNLRALFLLPPHTSNTNNLVFQYFLRGITAAANVIGCSLTVEEISEGQYGNLGRRANLPRAIRSEEADVVLLTGHHQHGDVAVLAQILPVVSIQWDYPGVAVDRVTAFNAAGVAETVDRLARQGHRRLAWMGESYPATFYEERQAGFIQGCLRWKILPEPDLFCTVGELNFPLIQRLLARGVTALVCANDNVAFQVAQLCCAHGLRIPEDLSLTGFDSVAQLLCNGKRLSGYDPCLVEIGQAAVQLALQRVNEPGAYRIIQSRAGHCTEGETIKTL